MTSWSSQNEQDPALEWFVVGLCHLSNIFCQLVGPLLILASIGRRSRVARGSAFQALVMQSIYLGLIVLVAQVGATSDQIGAVLLFGLLGPATIYIFVVSAVGSYRASKRAYYPYPLIGRHWSVASL